MRPKLLCLLGSMIAGLLIPVLLKAQPTEPAVQPVRVVAGPFDLRAAAAGPGKFAWFDGLAPIESQDSWTMTGWVYLDKPVTDLSLVAGFGSAINISGGERFLAVSSKGGLCFWGAGIDVVADAPLKVGRWRHVAASYDGLILRLFQDGKLVTSQAVRLTRSSMQVRLAPPFPEKSGQFAGRLGRFAIWGGCLAAERIAELAHEPVDLERADYPLAPTNGPDFKVEEGFPQRGQLEPQDPATWPGPVPPFAGQRKPKLPAGSPLSSVAADGRFVLNRGWEMCDAANVAAKGDLISQGAFETTDWYDATVPGTVLTTLVEQGIYPDPLHGLNNLVIPDDLARRSWWYRTRFTVPADWRERRVSVNFAGINYHAEAWLNGKPLGELTGAFLRGEFDATPLLRPDGENVLAVHVWPPPHPGGAQEESQLAGDGTNGGEQCLDGPTFFCTEGWDWIPTIRDRCTGIWQDVFLRAAGAVELGDSQVTTGLPMPDQSRADVTIKAELRNRSAERQQVVLRLKAAGAAVQTAVELAANETKTVTFASAQFPELSFDHPKLWWPNGYGEQTLHPLELVIVGADGTVSDRRVSRFGMRTISYDYLPALVVKVNGQRIFCQGGDWGMDDALKRVSRERLEPYFRLHHDAHLTMIRNWCGQSSEEVFYDLCDEYGLLVWNDFWLTTKGHDDPPLDAKLLLANAEDAVRHFRNHPSIAVWCGRNEGVPPPSLDEPLRKLVATLDGERIYESSSNSGPHLLPSGPWHYLTPLDYYKHAKGFSTELGINSVPTADAIRAMLEPADRWPLTGAWTYHDLHAFPHGPVKPYLDAIARDYGVSRDLEEFSRCAQMVNYVNHRAMFEAWNAKLWNPASGLLLWMSHPAWPSTVWQFYTQDYEAHAAYYGVKKGCEPVHVQWNVDDDMVAVSNHGTTAFPAAKIVIAIYGLDGQELARREVTMDVAASACAPGFKIEWPVALESPVVFVKLTLQAAGGGLLSENFYWRARNHEDQSCLQRLPVVQLDGTVQVERQGGEICAAVELSNQTSAVALMTHLVLHNAADGQRILPAYFDDNYVSLLPGEKRTICIRCDAALAAAQMQVSLDGWNIKPTVLTLERVH